MEKKSFMKKLTGSREALLAVILILLFAVITVISPSFLDLPVSDGYVEKQRSYNGNGTWYASGHAGRWN